MKITLIRQDNGSGKETLSICEAGTLFDKMKTETKAGHITALREIIPLLEGTYARYEHIDKLPYIYSAVEYTRTKEGERKMKQYNGLVQLEVSRLAGGSEAEFVKRQAALLPQTFAAFCGSSGRSVKIWVRFALPDDGGLPSEEAEAELFHVHSYRLAVKCYQPMLPFDIDLKEPVLTQKCRMMQCRFVWNSRLRCREKRLSASGSRRRKIRYCDCNRDMSRHKRSRRFMKRH